jgi:hypothetical protein
VLRLGARADVDEAFRVYFDALYDESAYNPKDARWVWGEGDFSYLLLKWTPNFGPAATEAAILWLPPTLPRLDDCTAAFLAVDAISWAFTADSLPRRKSDLTALQFSLLQTLSRQTNVSYGIPLIEKVLESLGLPNDMKRLKAFLE